VAGKVWDVRLFDEEAKSKWRNRNAPASASMSTAVSFVLGLTIAAFAQQQSLTGVVTDSMCGATHMAKDKTPAQCTQMCVKDGMKYALVADRKLYTLEGHEAELSKLAWPKSHG